MPDNLSFEKAAAGGDRPLRPGRVDPRRAHARPQRRGARARHHRPVLAAVPARGRGMSPVVGIDAVKMRRDAALAAGADHVIDPTAGDAKQQLAASSARRGAEMIADATGVPDAIPVAMSLACDAGQVVVVGSPRGRAKEVNFYDDLHRRYIEVTGRTGTCSSSRPTRGWPGRGTSTRRRLAVAATRQRAAEPRRARHAHHRAGATRHGLRGAAEGQGPLPRRDGEVGVSRLKLCS